MSFSLCFIENFDMQMVLEKFCNTDLLIIFFKIIFTLKSNMPHIVSDYRTLIVPSPQKVLIIGKPSPFNLNFHLREQVLDYKKGAQTVSVL